MLDPINIFIAEDDQDDLIIFADALKEIEPNVNIHSFGNGNELMDAMLNSGTIPDIIFLDINMPYANGMECLRELRNDIRFLRVPVIMLTTSGTREDIMDSFYAGATRYITKPNEFRSLLNVLEQLFMLFHARKLNKTDLLNFTMKPYLLSMESKFVSANELIF